jgi:hypothetical protein
MLLGGTSQEYGPRNWLLPYLLFQGLFLLGKFILLTALIQFRLGYQVERTPQLHMQAAE